MPHHNTDVVVLAMVMVIVADVWAEDTEGEDASCMIRRRLGVGESCSEDDKERQMVTFEDILVPVTGPRRSGALRFCRG